MLRRRRQTLKVLLEIATEGLGGATAGQIEERGKIPARTVGDALAWLEEQGYARQVVARGHWIPLRDLEGRPVKLLPVAPTLVGVGEAWTVHVELADGHVARVWLRGRQGRHSLTGTWSPVTIVAEADEARVHGVLVDGGQDASGLTVSTLVEGAWVDERVTLLPLVALVRRSWELVQGEG